MIIKPLSKESIIPNEEKAVAEILTYLPNDWLCICGNKDTYFTFTKDNKKIRGAQIDFVIINEYGVFFLEVKNVSLIKSEYNNLIFVTEENEEYNPIYRAIEYPNLAKNWFCEKLAGSKKFNYLTNKKHELKFGIWGSVIIANDNYRLISPQKELKLKNLNHHKQLTIAHRSELKRNFFKKLYNLKKSPQNILLSHKDRYILFNILLNQNIEVDSIFTPGMERNYKMLEYINKYGLKTKNSNFEELIHKVKEDKEEIEGKYAIVNQEKQILQNELENLQKRVEDQSIVIENLEKKYKKEITIEESLKENKKNQEHIIKILSNIVNQAFSSLIKYKSNFKEEKLNYINKIEKIKKVKLLNLIISAATIILIAYSIIFTSLYIREKNKEMPTPSQIFYSSYNQIKESFEQENYQELIENYKAQKYSLEFLNSKDVTKFGYYLGYSYFYIGNKNIGSQLLLQLDKNKLDINDVFSIYPDIYLYLKENNRFDDAGQLLLSMNSILDRQDELIQKIDTIDTLIKNKLFLLKAVSQINDRNSNEAVILNYLDSFGIKSSILERYTDDLNTIITIKVDQLRSKRDNRGNYPALEQREILENYKKILNYMKEIETNSEDSYHFKILSFRKLKLIVNTEIASINKASNNDEKAIKFILEAEKQYELLKDYYKDVNSIRMYINLFIIKAQIYENYMDLCNAYKSYKKSLIIANAIRPLIEMEYNSIDAKVNTIKIQLKEYNIECEID